MRQQAVTSTDPPVTINDCKISYNNTPYKWPYVQYSITNHSSHTIAGYQMVWLAYDKEGTPLELYWDARNVDASGGHGNVGFGFNGVDYGIVTGIRPNSPKSYDWLYEYSVEEMESLSPYKDDTKIFPGKTQTLTNGGWSLFDGWWDQLNGIHKASYIPSNVKQVTFDDGTTWVNPEYAGWLAAYKGKTIDVGILEPYYPYK